MYSASRQRFRGLVPYVSSDMKWWGWGHEGTSFEHEDKPGLRPFILRHLEIDIARATSAPVAFDDLRVPPPSPAPGLAEALADAVGGDHVSSEAMDRVVHARGKSLRELVHQRGGRARPVTGPGGAPGQRGRGGGGPARGARGRRRRDPVRRRLEHLRQPGGAGGRGETGRLGRSRPPGPGGLDRPGLARRRGPGGRVRPATSRRSSTRRDGRSAISRTASPTRRSAAGSRPARRGCSPTSTATSRT